MHASTIVRDTRRNGSTEEFTFEQVAQAVESALSTAWGGGKAKESD